MSAPQYINKDELREQDSMNFSAIDQLGSALAKEISSLWQVFFARDIKKFLSKNLFLSKVSAKIVLKISEKLVPTFKNTKIAKNSFHETKRVEFFGIPKNS